MIQCRYPFILFYHATSFITEKGGLYETNQIFMDFGTLYDADTFVEPGWFGITGFRPEVSYGMFNLSQRFSNQKWLR